MKNISLLLASALLVAVQATSIFAQDEELYGAPLPDDAAFVRVLGAQEGDAVDAFGVTLTNDGHYTVILADTTDGIEPNQYVTVLPGATVVHLPLKDTTKVQIGLFNGGYESDVVLKTADGKVTIAEATSNGAGFREVNPIVVPVAVFAGDEMLGERIELQLRRGENPTLFVAPDGRVTTIISKVLWEQ